MLIYIFLQKRGFWIRTSDVTIYLYVKQGIRSELNNTMVLAVLSLVLVYQDQASFS